MTCKGSSWLRFEKHHAARCQDTTWYWPFCGVGWCGSGQWSCTSVACMPHCTESCLYTNIPQRPPELYLDKTPCNAKAGNRPSTRILRHGYVEVPPAAHAQGWFWRLNDNDFKRDSRRITKIPGYKDARRVTTCWELQIRNSFKPPSFVPSKGSFDPQLLGSALPSANFCWNRDHEAVQLIRHCKTFNAMTVITSLMKLILLELRLRPLARASEAHDCALTAGHSGCRLAVLPQRMRLGAGYCVSEL